MKQWVLFAITIVLVSTTLMGEEPWKDKRERPEVLNDVALFRNYWRDRELKNLVGVDGRGNFPSYYHRACEAMKLGETTRAKMEETWLEKKEKNDPFVKEYWDTIRKLEDDIELEKKAGKKTKVPAMVTRLQRHRKDGFIKIMAMDRKLCESFDELVGKKKVSTWRAYVMAEWSMIPFRYLMDERQVVKVHELCMKKRGPISTIRSYKPHLLATWEIRDMIYSKLLTKTQKDKVRYRSWREEIKKWVEEREQKKAKQEKDKKRREEEERRKKEKEARKRENRENKDKDRKQNGDDKPKPPKDKPAPKDPDTEPKPDEKPKEPDDNIGGF